MSSSARAVDVAMAAERAEKQTMRGFWLDVALNFAEAYPDDTFPLYLTLSGAEGRDISLLIDAGLVRTTPTGAIAQEHAHRVVAVEQSTDAVAALQRRFPGLKIFEQPFQNLVRGQSPLRWPESDEERLCCARVINLDLNGGLHCTSADTFFFPVLRWIEKLGQIHATRRCDWALCLTLHSEIGWDDMTCRHVQVFIAENCARDEEFARAAADHLGTDLLTDILAGATIGFAQLATEIQQRLLMLFVPKKLTQLLHSQGWLVRTERNVAYGGGRSAPMVSWVVTFAWDTRAVSQPDAVYREGLRNIFWGVGRIAEDGSISQ